MIIGGRSSKIISGGFFLSLFGTLGRAILVLTLDLVGGVQPGYQSSAVISDVTSPVKSCQEN